MLKRIAVWLLAAVWALVLTGCNPGTGPVQSPEGTVFLPSAVQTEVPETEVPETAGPETPDPETAAPETPAPVEDTPAPATEAPGVDEDGFYHTKDEVALYLHLYGHLPTNYVTKREAQELGWTGGSVERYAGEGTAIGGSRFGNYEGRLPEKEGRTYQECDIDTVGRSSRGAKRIVFSNDGLIYYTGDHYESFELLYGEP